MSEILPNEVARVAFGFRFMVVFAVLSQAGLAFLGLWSVSSLSWGTALYWAQNSEAFTLGDWWWYVPPGLCIALLGTGLVLLTFVVDTLADPRLLSQAPAGGRR